MASKRRRGRAGTVVLSVVLGAVVLVSLARRQRLAAATRDFHERYGPLHPPAS
jgi:hypothetical protein